MKSIKDKAEEKYPMITGELQTYNEKFIEGANYVLEEIEEFQKLFSTCMNAHANGYLKSVIEQLKK
jgi:hypothetical protein